MNILVLNCGSSSIKYQMLDMSKEYTVKAKGLIERVGLENGMLNHKTFDGKVYEIEQPIPNHTVGIKLVLDALINKDHGVLGSLNEIDAVGHRVAHGGEYFTKSVLLDADAISKIEACSDIAPLHNPAHLLGIRAILEVLPNVIQTAVFDTSFHQTMPAEAFMYALPYRMYEDYKIRRYGFHGTSHKFVAEKACKMLNWNIEDKKIITCHLGNGASICAIKYGKSVDTSMGFTPVEGLVMGTRVGDIDAGALLYIMDKENLNTSKTNSFINKSCGLNGVSEVSSDMRDLEKASSEGNNKAQLALDMFVYRVKKYIGAYAAAMNGVDLIIMTGGIGENACNIRENVFTNMEYFGIEFDAKLNDNLRGKDAIISKESSKVTLMTITTNEELVIALDTMKLAGA
ncbi:MAG: acetate kinase [Bacteroidales bacterium]|jgi:acetate kinase|nr:acetate kinase [Bacteroidales bacterium]